MSLTNITDPLTDEELADFIHELADILHDRLQASPHDEDESWAVRQTENANIEVRSWPTWRQNASRGALGRAGH